jgi:hypothetical protein
VGLLTKTRYLELEWCSNRDSTEIESGEGESDMGYQYGRAYKYITLGIPLKK